MKEKYYAVLLIVGILLFAVAATFHSLNATYTTVYVSHGVVESKQSTSEGYKVNFISGETMQTDSFDIYNYLLVNHTYTLRLF